MYRTNENSQGHRKKPTGSEEPVGFFLASGRFAAILDYFSFVRSGGDTSSRGELCYTTILFWEVQTMIVTADDILKKIPANAKNFFEKNTAY